MESDHSVNWVKSRAECFLPKVFRHLRAHVRYDVAEANQHAPVIERGFTFTVEDHDTSFTVIRTTPPPEQTVAVKFELGPDAIRVECPSHPVYSKRGYFLIVSKWENAHGRLCANH